MKTHRYKRYIETEVLVCVRNGPTGPGPVVRRDHCTCAVVLRLVRSKCPWKSAHQRVRPAFFIGCGRKSLVFRGNGAEPLPNLAGVNRYATQPYAQPGAAYA